MFGAGDLLARQEGSSVGVGEEGEKEARSSSPILDSCEQVGEGGSEHVLVGRKRMFSEVNFEDETEDPRVPMGGKLDEVRCCPVKCRDALERPDDVKAALQSEFGELPKAEAKMKLLKHVTSQDNLGLLTDRINWKGKYLCSKTFSMLSGMSRFLIDSVLIAHGNGVREFKHGNSGLPKFSENLEKFKTWVKGFLMKNSQSAPDNNVQVVAHWVKIGDMHQWYKKETVEPHLALKTFYEYMKNHFGPRRVDRSEPQIRFSLYSSHSVCDQCQAFNNERRNCKTEGELRNINQSKMLHLAKAAGARQKMNELIQHSIQFPEDSMVLVYDGMDNSKSYLPNYREKTKKLAGMYRLPTKIQGGIIYSGNYLKKRKVMFLLNNDQFEQSSNMIVSSIFVFLEGFLEDKWQLPKVLHLFADNCGRENKNRWGFQEACIQDMKIVLGVLGVLGRT